MGHELLSLLEISPYRLFNPARVHFVLWGYFDESRDDVKGYITLAGIVSSESIWPEFERAWINVLSQYGLSEFHMTDAMAKPPRGAFAGWDDEAIRKVCNDLINTIAKFSGRQDAQEHREFLLKSCTVKLEDYYKVAAENPYLRRPQAMCVDFCCGTGLPVDPANPGAEHQDVIFYFDENEKYLRHIKSTWDKWKKHRTGWPSQVKQILAVSGENVPALQAADILAWSSNGFHKGDERAIGFFPLIPLSGGIYQFYDFDSIKKKYGGDTPGTDPYAYKARER